MREFHIKEQGGEFVERLEAKFADPEKLRTASKRCFAIAIGMLITNLWYMARWFM